MSGNITDSNPSNLGDGAPGVQPPHIILMVGTSERGRDRAVLREAFGNKRLPGQTVSAFTNPNQALGPFRSAMNAGDRNLLVNESPNLAFGASNQVNNVRPSIGGSKRLGGGVRNGNASFSGNSKFVYDGSDYTRFKKLQAKNRNYNDSTYGGSNNGSYTFLMRVRR